MQRAAPAEAVAEAAHREQQAREHERVRVDHPLELAVAGVEVANERRDRDVEDRVVEHDHEQAQAEHDEDPPAAAVHLRVDDLVGQRGVVGHGARSWHRVTGTLIRNATVSYRK